MFLVTIACGCGGGSSTSSNTGQSPDPPSQPAAPAASPWSLRFASNSGNLANSIFVDANLIQSSAGITAPAMRVQGACVSPTPTTETFTGTLGSTVSLTVAYGGVTMLLTGTLATDGNSMTGTYTMSGACGVDNGRWAGFKVAAITGSYSGFLQATDSYVLNGYIQGDFAVDTNFNVSGNFGSSVPCFSNLNVQGVQIGGAFSGTAAGGSAQFNFESSDIGSDSMTGLLTVNQACYPFGNGPSGAAFTLTKGTSASTIAVPNLPPVLTAVSPTKVANVDLGGVNVLGSNFTSKSQVLIDGMPAYVTSLISPGFLSASLLQMIGQGVHSVSVTDSGNTSNILPLTVYVPSQGPQSFLSPSLLASVNTSPGPISVADINGDGIPDLFVPGSTETLPPTPGRVFVGRGDGTFQFAANTSPNGFMVADLNGDGLAELIGYDDNELLIWPGSGDPAYNTSPLTVSPAPLIGNPRIMKVTDIDGDGHLDVIVNGTIYFGRGNLQFDVVQTNSAWPFAIGDFNGDGKPDIFAGAYTLLNNGNRTFTSIPSLLSQYVSSVSVGDFNGDGILDLVTTNLNTSSGGILLINYGRGDGTFYIQGEISTADSIQSIAVGDFNHDGRLDVATGFLTTPQIGVFTNDGQGGFQVSNAPSGGRANQVVEADFNRDGKPDLAVLTDFANVWILLGK